MTKILGIDIGGTFTDLFFLDETTGGVRISKSSTTRGRYAEGLFNAMDRISLSPSAVDIFMHGTTIVTNALIERRGARCGMILTEGFRDVLELGRRERPQAYGMYGLQQPLVTRDMRLEVPERLDAQGEVVVPLDEEAVDLAGRRLLRMGADAVTVCFLHSYANPEHERRAAEILRGLDADWIVNASSDLLPEYYEFERFSTASVHTFVQPMVKRYVEALKGDLARSGYERDVLFVQSNGGIMSSRSAAEKPANLALSGPAAGVIAASYLARAAGFDNVISADMGGTSFDVCLVPGGKPRTTEETQIDFRLPLRVSMVDVNTVGAGGGSIARIDRGGILNVGPESAGATPGPVAYGRGGTEPTVTDANLVLGRINPDFVLGGEKGFRMDRDAARDAIEKRIAMPLGVSVEAAASAIIRVANNNMAGRVRVVSVERGYDPRDFVLVAFGGAGPLHGAALLKETGVAACLVPLYPGVLCALGSAAADVRHDFVQTVMKTTDELDFADLQTTIRRLVTEGRALIEQEAIPVREVAVLLEADMAYEGQRHDIRIPLSENVSRESLEAAFTAAYRAEYGKALDGIRIRLTTVRAATVGIRSKPEIGASKEAAGSLADARTGERQVHFDDGWRETPIYSRRALAVGHAFAGPAVVEQDDTTVVIEPGVSARVDAQRNLVLEIVKS